MGQQLDFFRCERQFIENFWGASDFGGLRDIGLNIWNFEEQQILDKMEYNPVIFAKINTAIFIT